MDLKKENKIAILCWRIFAVYAGVFKFFGDNAASIVNVCNSEGAYMAIEHIAIASPFSKITAFTRELNIRVNLWKLD